MAVGVAVLNGVLEMYDESTAFGIWVLNIGIVPSNMPKVSRIVLLNIVMGH